MKSLQFAVLIFTAAIAALTSALATSDEAYPPPYGLNDQPWTMTTTTTTTSASAADDLVPVRREVYGGGRIIDISHRLRSEMPSWGSSEGLGHFLWLDKSMKNGSHANNSKMKIPTHTGTHVDAPGHVFDHYFDAGFDVDTLDLEVLNGKKYALKLHQKGRGMRFVHLLVIWAVIQAITLLSVPSNGADPSGYCAESVAGARDVSLGPLRREVYENGEIFDITHRFTPHTPVGISNEGIGEFLTLLRSMKNGSDYNFSEMRIPAHAGTHVDAPGHFYENYFEEGYDVDSLDLRVLNGEALLVDVPRDKNITADVMKSLHIPKGVKRVLFRTQNTDRRLMFKKEFDTSYVGFMKDGAQWLVDNTDIKLVGIDYLSVAAYDDLITSHLVFLKSREIILVEGLKLDDVKPGLYTVHCLPLRLLGSEGSPIRCILIN